MTTGAEVGGTVAVKLTVGSGVAVAEGSGLATGVEVSKGIRASDVEFGVGVEKTCTWKVQAVANKASSVTSLVFILSSLDLHGPGLAAVRCFV